jgi:hypothetical protein
MVAAPAAGLAASVLPRRRRKPSIAALARVIVSPETYRNETGKTRRHYPNHLDKNPCENLCPDLNESLT